VCSLLSVFYPSERALLHQTDNAVKVTAFLVFASVCFMLFYSPREECIFAQTLLLQLLQSCFSVLTGDNKTAKPQETSQSKTFGHREAAEELYRHLCEGNLYGIYELFCLFWLRSVLQ